MLENLAHVAQIRDHLLRGILEEIPDVKINSPVTLSESGGALPTAADSMCLPYILNVSFLGTRAEVLLHMLEQSEIYVSTGSACSSNSKKKGSHVLRAIGLSDDEIEGAVRFSFSYQNTMEEIEETLEKLKEAVEYIEKCWRWRINQRRREGAEKAECAAQLPSPRQNAVHDAEKVLRKQAVSAAYNGNRMAAAHRSGERYF